MTTNELDGLRVLERGWLSSNSVLLCDKLEATLVDSGHVSHAVQTVALVRHALGGRRLARVVNTHLHSDHCGGNAALQRAFGCEVWIPPGHWEDVLRWNEAALSYAATGQACERFVATRALAPAQTLALGGRQWRVLAAPGHDPHAVILFDAASGVLISADALWEDGFGVVFPELDGEAAFAEVAATLEVIEALPVAFVIPGHGAPFRNVAEAIARARRRLRGFESDPRSHAWYAAKVLLKFHLLDRQSVGFDALCAWAAAIPYLEAIRTRHFAAEGGSAWCRRIVDSLCRSGAARMQGGSVMNR